MEEADGILFFFVLGIFVFLMKSFAIIFFDMRESDHASSFC